MLRPDHLLFTYLHLAPAPELTKSLVESGATCVAYETVVDEPLMNAIRELPERERQILALYYEEEMTMAEIGEVIGVCESRVSQLRSLALSRLRASLKKTLGEVRR